MIMASNPKLSLLLSYILLALLILFPPCAATRRLLQVVPVTKILADGTTVVLGGARMNIHPVTDGSSPPQQFDPSLPAIGPPSLLGNGIQYHGGPVMKGVVNTYVIFYGGWSGNNATSIIPGFLGKIGGTPYFGINKLYTDATGSGPSNQVAFVSSTSPGYPYGTSIDNTQTQQVVADAIQNGTFPLDSNGVYFVVTSADVAQSTSSTSTFCGAYCGYHSYFTYGSTTVKYAFIGNTDRCPSACTGYPGNAPNGNAGADGMVSIVAHELEETVSDELINAWYDSKGEENADKCAYNYGTMYTTSNGQKANVNFGGTDYFIQQNWKPAYGGYCALS